MFATGEKFITDSEEDRKGRGGMSNNLRTEKKGCCGREYTKAEKPPKKKKKKKTIKKTDKV